MLPAFLEFAPGATLVAHNARSTWGSSRPPPSSTASTWPAFDVLDTARLARRTLDRDEAPNCKLATLARLFRATTTPTHRALDDARATVDVLHGLFERVGCFGVTTARRARHVLHPRSTPPSSASGTWPTASRAALVSTSSATRRQRVLYIGKSVDLRPRVRQYFTAAECRRRMAEMVAAAEEVVALPCATLLEAEVRELRLIAEYKPPYNRRSRFPEKVSFLKLTAGPFPRLSIVREVKDDGCTYLGPFSSRRQAEQARDALHETFPLRQCTQTLVALVPPVRRASWPRCTAAAPRARDARASTSYAQVVEAAAAAMHADARPRGRRPRRDAWHRSSPMSASRRPSATATGCGRCSPASARAQRLRALGGVARARRGASDADGGWEIAVIRHGRLAAAGLAARGVAPKPFIAALRAGAEPVAASRRRVPRGLGRGGRVPAALARLPRGPAGPPRGGLGQPPPRLTRARVGSEPDHALGVRRPSMITAIVFVQCDVDQIPSVAESIAVIPEVSEVYSVTGGVDLIAMIRVHAHDELAEVITGRLAKIPGIVHTETHIAFRAYSRHDLEAAFSLGLE